MKFPSFKRSYNKQTEELLKKIETDKAVSEVEGVDFEAEIDKAMSEAVGGNFEAVGMLEYDLLLQYGLEKNHCVIDIGCGSGRLGFQLQKYLEGEYIGSDVVRELFEYAEKKCNRSDWRFYEAPGLTIPEPDNYSDFICFFSVFTHLLHEESYKYLKEAKRVIKPMGKIIFSFLEFKIPSHWNVFEQVLLNTNPEKVLNQFLSRDAIDCWAEHLDLEIVDIHDGDKPHIILNNIVTWDDGRQMIDIGNLGQSVCILTKY